MRREVRRGHCEESLTLYALGWGRGVERQIPRKAHRNTYSHRQGHPRQSCTPFSRSLAANGTRILQSSKPGDMQA